MITGFFSKIKFDLTSDRMGPDCPFLHWKLYFKPLSLKLCKKKFAYFGENADFRAGAYAINCSKIYLGQNVVIRPNTMLFADARSIKPNIIIRKNAMLGSGVHIYTSNHHYSEPSIDIIFQGHMECKQVVINQGAWIGSNTVILPGVNIGKNSVVGAGSVVTKDVPDRTVYAGVPAKFIKAIIDE